MDLALGEGYSSVGTVRSALSSKIKRVNAVTLGKQPLLLRYMITLTLGKQPLLQRDMIT